MSVGHRIKERLREIQKDAKWLYQVTHIPMSTLYEIMNGRMKTTTRLPTIAAALGLRAVWLERNLGPRLLSDADSKQPPKDTWPFSFSPTRFERLKPAQRKQIERLVLALILDFEAGSIRPKTPTKTVARAGATRATL